MATKQLQEYNRKRDFRKTPEPKGGDANGSGRRYCVQKHAARRLHYDLRLELDGVLKSWAVPKGPALDPKERRLAVHVEDHPLEYGSFEGTIPEKQYGAGTVMLWDTGEWEPANGGDVAKAYKKGKLKFRIRGEKLHGVWNLVRMRGKASEDGDNWLLIKEDDEEARPLKKYDILEVENTSVLTGRDLDEIAAAENGDVKKKSKTKKAAKAVKLAKPSSLNVGKLPKAKKAAMPKSLSPQLATLVKTIPAGDNWLHETKFDGYRLISRIEKNQVRLFTRNGKDWTDKFEIVAKAIEKMEYGDMVADGELTVLLPNGRSDFQSLQNAIKGSESANFVYYLFDVLYLDGYDLRKVPLLERKELLRKIVPPAEAGGRLRYSEHITGRGDTVYQHACRLGLEGVISKRADSAYEHKRTRTWVKTKCSKRQEFVIGGYSEPGGARSHFGALVLGYYDDGELVYCGRVGTGFNERSLKSIYSELTKRERKTPPFDAPPKGPDAKGVHWVTPDLVCEVEFTEWTGEGILRHPSFQGLRMDKPAKDVRREDELEDAAPPSKTSDEPVNDEVAIVKRVSKKAGDIEVAGVRISSPDRVLYPDQGVTKQALAEFYVDIADWVLPYVVDRPLSIVRCPAGRQKQCFYQKHFNESLPSAVQSIKIKEKKDAEDYIYIKDIEGLVSLVQLGVLEIHPWGAKTDNVDKPDVLTFDLDPDEGMKWDRIVEATYELRDFLEELGLQSFLKTTGGKGLHIVTPITRRSTWDEAKEFARAIATKFAERDKSKYVATASKAKRKGRIYIDYLRNARGATSVAAYSTRAKAGATVSTPLRWDELSSGVKSDSYNVTNLARRLSMLKSDPWAEYFTVRQSITAAARKQLGL